MNLSPYAMSSMALLETTENLAQDNQEQLVLLLNHGVPQRSQHWIAICPHLNDAGAPPRNDGVSGTRGMLGPYNPGGTFGVPQSLRVACGNCNSPFSVAGDPSNSEARQNALISCLSGGTSAGAAGLIAARCPHCRKVTSVGPAYARVRLVVYGLLTLVALILAIGVTAGTAKVAQENKALYFLWSVLYLVVVVLGLRAVVFLLMPVSSVEVPVLHI
ncbi:hypothetical protein CRM22_004557 [Opisthorchis felineus]|uniref:Phosphatidylinositol-4,5-bisphosphate 4-phosphatase n=1 Tax=Opisthorchis felineus TaxID=147828 RepID=A0A4S2LVJ3_OPIFE|nr:hypothetical protein CRM22_004557 [Opisthorchis felineus]